MAQQIKSLIDEFSGNDVGIDAINLTNYKELKGVVQVKTDLLLQAKELFLVATMPVAVIAEQKRKQFKIAGNLVWKAKEAQKKIRSERYDRAMYIVTWG